MEFTVSRWSWPLILSLIQAWRTRTDAQTSGWPVQKRNPIETKTKTRLLNAWYRLCIVFTRRSEFDSGHANADASPSQLNQTNKPPHVARKLRFSEIRSGMLFITSLLVEDFRHSLILFVCFNFAPKNHGLVPQSELPLLGLCVTPYSIMPTSAFPIDWSMS